MKHTDEQLIAGYGRSGDESLFAELVSRLENEVVGYLRRVTGSRELAEEAAQQTFLVISRKAESFDEERKARAWIFAIATNAGIDLMRREARHAAISLQLHVHDEDNADTLADVIVGNEPAASDTVQLGEDCEWLMAALEHLPQDQFDTIQAIYFEGLSYQAVADRHGCPLGTIKSRANAGLKVLKTLNRKKN